MITTITPPPAAIETDDNGFPTRASLENIRSATDMLSAARWLVETFPALVECLPYGKVTVTDEIDERGTHINLIKYSTGGWKGAEAIADAVEHGVAGFLYLWSWRRDGHYEFRVPFEDVAA